LANRNLNKDVQRVADEAMRMLLGFNWPGNIRQLQAVIRQGVLQTTGPVLLSVFLPDALQRERGGPEEQTAAAKDALDQWIEDSLVAGSTTLYDDVIANVDRRIITQVLMQTGGSQSEAARLLGMSRTTLRAKLEKLGIKIDRVVQSDQ
jgi:two-component system nitrogen regulation response regulator GlnG